MSLEVQRTDNLVFDPGDGCLQKIPINPKIWRRISKGRVSFSIFDNLVSINPKGLPCQYNIENGFNGICVLFWWLTLQQSRKRSLNAK